MDMYRIPEIEDEFDDVDEVREKRDREYAEWIANREPDPVGLWDTNPENAYRCAECPHRDEGSYNTERPCGCMACWVTVTCRTNDSRDDWREE